MALSSCAGAPAKPNEKAGSIPFDTINEDTTAREDVFGPAQQAKGLNVRKINAVTETTNYKIGYQLHFDDKGNADDTDDVISIRFVAAINDTYQSMVWSRGLSRGDGSETKRYGNTKRVAEEDIPLASTVVYTSLSSGGDDPIVAGEDAFEKYSGFVVYSMTDIPYEAYKDSFIAVSLTLDPNTSVSNDEIVTPIYAVKIEADGFYEGSVFAFSFAQNVNTYNGYFLYGFFNGVRGIKIADNPTVGSNNASYTHLSLVGVDQCDFDPGVNDKPYDFPDTFASFYFKDSRFKYFSAEQHDYEDSGSAWSHFDESDSYFDVESGMVYPLRTGEHALFISSGNTDHVYSLIYGDNIRYTVTGSPGWVSSDVSIPLFAYVVYNTEPETGAWISVSVDSGNLVFDAPNNAKRFLLVRCANGTTTPDWEATGDNEIYNKTSPDFNVDFGGTYTFNAADGSAHPWVEYDPS